MAKATQPFHAVDPTTGVAAYYEKGAEVPDAVARTVGGHVLDSAPEQAEDNGPTFDGEAFDAAVEARVAEVVQEREEAAVAAYRQRDEAARSADGFGAFDPSEVGAPEVRAYLEGLDVSTASGQGEYDRVVAAETGDGGKNRSSAIPS